MPTASHRAFEAIRAAILDGRFTAGAHLTESELTEICGVSRTPVREALRRLAEIGLVDLTPHHGARVIEVDLDEIDEIYALRAFVEGRAAARAAERFNAPALAALVRLADEMEHAVVGGLEDRMDRFLRANSRFHGLILEAAASPRLSAMAGLVNDMPLALRTFARYSEAEVARSLRHHRELIAAFQARDPAWAEAVMRGHVLAAAHALRRARDQPAASDEAPRRLQVGGRL